MPPERSVARGKRVDDRHFRRPAESRPPPLRPPQKRGFFKTITAGKGPIARLFEALWKNHLLEIFAAQSGDARSQREQGSPTARDGSHEAKASEVQLVLPTKKETFGKEETYHSPCCLRMRFCRGLRLGWTLRNDILAFARVRVDAHNSQLFHFVEVEIPEFSLELSLAETIDAIEPGAVAF